MHAMFNSLVEHLPAMAILLGGLIAAGGAFWAESARKGEAGKPTLKPGLTILAVALIGLTGTFGEEFQTSHFQRQLIDAQGKLLEAEGHNSELSGQLIAKGDEIERLGRSNDEKSDKIIALNQRISGSVAENLNSLTGGDSFCYVILSMERDKLPVYVAQHGRNHVLDVYVRVVDLDSLPNAVTNGTMGQDSNVFGKQFSPLATVQRGTITPLAEYPPLPSEVEYKKFNIFMMARYGSFTELLRLRRRPDNHMWSTATLVTASYYDGKRGVVFEETRGGFPTETLKADRDWVEAEKLPKLHIQN